MCGAVGRSSWIGLEGARFSCIDVDFITMVEIELEMLCGREKIGLC